MNPDKIFFITSLLLYGATTLYCVRLWKSGFREKFFPWGLLPGLAFVAHTLAIFLRGFSLNACPIHNLFEAGMFIGWFLSLASLGALFLPQLRFFTAFLSPLLFLLGLFSLLPVFDTPRAVPLPEWVSLHATFAFLAYGAWGIASAAALMFLIQQRDLKRKRIRALTNILPPVQKIKSLALGMVLAGEFFLSIGLLFGIRGHHTETGFWIAGDPKILWALALWVYFFLLIVIHYLAHPSDRVWTLHILCGFIFILLTFWPTSALSPTHGPSRAVQSTEVLHP